MNPAPALTTLAAARDRKNECKMPTALNRAPASTTSTSLIVVMIVYVLFGFAGFYAAAQVTVL